MLRDICNGLLVAFGMYSALPLPQVEWKENTMRYALAFLPFIGVIIGLCEYGWLYLAHWLNLTGILYAAGAVLVPIILTGGIHLDGFTDTCDALCSYGNRQKRLEILKDPHIGAFGVLWLIVLLLAQFGLFAQLYETSQFIGLLLAGYMLARAFGGSMIVTRKCAKDSGLARMFADHADKKIVSRIMYVWMAASLVLLLFINPFVGTAAFAINFLFFKYYIHHCEKIFGGITGDLCGMCITVCELLTLLAAVIGGICGRI